jgi:hypothetical protein
MAGPAERREQLTPNRSAGRIEDELWDPFRDWCKREGLSHSDGIRRLIRGALGMPEPVPLADTGSGSDRVAAS